MSIQNSDHVWSAGGLVFKELASQNDVLVCGFAEPILGDCLREGQMAMNHPVKRH